MKASSILKPILFCCLFFLFAQLPCFSQAVLGTNTNTQIKVFEYYKHGSAEWVKLFHVRNQGWARGGVSGVVHFIDYAGEGAGMVEFTIPQQISSTQKPTLVLHGNAADDFNWHVHPSTYNGISGYDVYIQTPGYHAGLTFMLRGFDYTPFFTADSAPVTAPAWSSIANKETITFFKSDGSVGIGTITPEAGYRLSVHGTVRAKEIKVDASWADYVFEDDYKLLSLNEVEDFISKNGHLPDVPSAKTVEAEGVNVGEMESTLLRKIEELTLYVIEQNKQLIKLQEENKEFRKIIQN